MENRARASLAPTILRQVLTRHIVGARLALALFVLLH